MKERNFFHGEVKADLEEAGYTVFLETDKEWTYTGRENQPTDALAFKGNVVISIEMKTEQELSPKSPPSGDSLKYDYSTGTREKGRTMIENGEITREEGMHRVHINQPEHYANKLEFLDKESGRELSKSGGRSASEPGCSVEIYNGAVDPILQRGKPQHICYLCCVFLNPKTYGLKIKQKHFLVLFRDLRLARYSRF